MEARTQMHYARRGEITDAMRFVAEREEIQRFVAGLLEPVNEIGRPRHSGHSC